MQEGMYVCVSMCARGRGCSRTLSGGGAGRGLQWKGGVCVCVRMYACGHVRACVCACHACMRVCVGPCPHTRDTAGGGGRNVIMRDGETLWAQTANPNRWPGKGEKRKGVRGSSFSLGIICFSDNYFPGNNNIFT